MAKHTERKTREESPDSTSRGQKPKPAMLWVRTSEIDGMLLIEIRPKRAQAT